MNKGYSKYIRKRKFKRQMIVLGASVVVAAIVLLVAFLGRKNVNNTDRKSQMSDTKKDNNKGVIDSEQDVSTEEIMEKPTEEETTEVKNDKIDPAKPMVALTFDDGPNSKTTPRILDALKAAGGHATFFMVGYNMEGNEDIIKRVADEGNEVANHTVSHKRLTKIDQAQMESEIMTTRNKIAQITGQQTVLLRPPYGDANEAVMNFMTDPVILWSVDTEDWKSRNSQSVIQNIQNNVFDGAIVLMHDIYPETADAAVEAITWLKEQGYQLVTVSELGYYRRGGLKTGVKYGSLMPE